MISSSSRATVVDEQRDRGAPVCTMNTQVEDAGIPDLNIAHIPDEDGVNGGLDGEEESRPSVAIIEPPGWLPEDWIVECRTRKDGTKDKFYIESFTGRRFRSKVEVLRYLETGVVTRWKKKRKQSFESGAEQCAPASCERAFFSTRSGATNSTSPVRDSSGGAAPGRGVELPSAHVSFENLRGMILNGFTAPLAIPLKRNSFEDGEEDRRERSSVKRPVFSDTWTSSFGSSERSTWTGSFLNGSASGSEGATPHWLDRILNKPPPAAISQPSYGLGLSGNFVQSPLHYLQNAGAFQNSWLNLKPPSAITQTLQPPNSDATWKSKSWLEKREPPRAERHSINLNQPVPDPEEDKYHGDYRHRESGKASTSFSSLESLWKKAIPITLEHREYVASANGSPSYNNLQPHFQRPPHQQQQQLPGFQFQSQQLQQAAVKRTSNKVDRHMEKKRLERLGALLCHQGLARLLSERAQPKQANP